MTDSLGMLDAAAAMPDHIAAAVEAAHQVDNLPDPAGITSVLVLGMGGSGVAGEFLTVTAGPFMPLPVVVVKNFVPPSYVGPSTLVFSVSFSGNTAETLEATMAAANAGAKIVGITTGGELERLCNAWSAPVIPVDSSIPQPRAGLGAMAIPPLIVLENLGMFPGATEWVRRAVEQLRRRTDQLLDDGNDADELAMRLAETVPLVYGGGGLGMVAARRWKTQINENAEMPAFSADVPELCHNEIAGWGQLNTLTSAAFSLVTLRHDHEHPLIMRAFDIVGEVMEPVTAGRYRVDAEGDGPIAQMLDLISFGDFVSTYLALRTGVDPGPIDVLTDLKQRLAD